VTAPIEAGSAGQPIDRQCTAKSNRTGQRCKRAACKGGRVCATHGGRAPQVKRKATERVIEERARAAAADYVPAASELVDPVGTLLKVAGEVLGFKAFVGQRLAELQADSWRYRGEQGEQLRAEVALYERALDRATKVLIEINRLGLEQRKQAFDERQGVELAAVIHRILDRLVLTPEQMDLMRVVVPEELRKIDHAITGGAG
jgi:hypothetical protein